MAEDSVWKETLVAFGKAMKSPHRISRRQPLRWAATTFHRPTSELETRAGLKQESGKESRAERVEQRILSILRQTPLSRSEISIGLGHKSISGRLNGAIRLLMDDKLIEYTIPERPNSRLQKYRLTENGKSRLAELENGRS